MKWRGERGSGENVTNEKEVFSKKKKKENRLEGKKK